jgi:hypothetical protein
MHINQAYEDHPELFIEPKNALYYAMKISRSKLEKKE